LLKVTNGLTFENLKSLIPAGRVAGIVVIPVEQDNVIKENLGAVGCNRSRLSGPLTKG
jgi:hypothetical protein